MYPHSYCYGEMPVAQCPPVVYLLNRHSCRIRDLMLYWAGHLCQAVFMYGEGLLRCWMPTSPGQTSLYHGDLPAY